MKVALFAMGAAVSLSPFGICALVVFNQTHVYAKTYYAALVDKYNYLESVRNEKKIILVGGSNVAFGFNSELIEQEFPEYKVVNFGLYANLGTKIMLDLALDFVGEGDQVFVIPEINEQSTSLFFNAEAALKAAEDRMDVLTHLPTDNFQACLGKSFEFAFGRAMQSGVIEPTGVYQRRNFNKHGDIQYEEKDQYGDCLRSRNQMALHYDLTMPVDYSYAISEDFVRYLNDYDQSVRNKGASLYYAFSPVNSLSVIDRDATIDYYWSLRDSLSFPVIGNPLEYILDPHYFFDSNFHLNDSGAILRTYEFVADCYRDIYRSAKSPSFPVPEPPDYPKDKEIHEDSETAPFFDYIEREGSLLVNGVKDSYATEKEIVLPEFAQGKPVIGIANAAFSNCTAVETIFIPAFIHALIDGCFSGCPTLKVAVIETTNPSDISVSYTGQMTDGVADGFRIYIHGEAFEAFATDYFWGAYTRFFERY